MWNGVPCKSAKVASKSKQKYWTRIFRCSGNYKFLKYVCMHMSAVLINTPTSGQTGLKRAYKAKVDLYFPIICPTHFIIRNSDNSVSMQCCGWGRNESYATKRYIICLMSIRVSCLLYKCFLSYPFENACPSFSQISNYEWWW